MNLLRHGILGAGAATLLGAALPSHALLMLTAEGLAAGFTLATVVSGLPTANGNGYDALGSAVTADGRIVVNNSADGRNYVFRNVDGQTTADALGWAPDPGFPTAIVNAGGRLYAGGGPLRRLHDDGSTAQTWAGVYAQFGMWTNPLDQHIIAIGRADGVGDGLLDIDVSGTVPVARRINGMYSDGVTVSADGRVVYTNHAAYRIDTGELLASYFVSGADGMGVITGNTPLDGRVIVSTTDGRLVMLDPLNAFSAVEIASGGGYGDFANADPTTGTLLVSFSNSLVRLGCGPGCGIGAPAPAPAAAAEPSIVALIGAGLAMLGCLRRRSVIGRASTPATEP